MPPSKTSSSQQGRDTFAKRRAPAAAVAGVLALLAPLTAPQAASASTVPATSDTSPVNLSTPVDMAAGKAAQRATVVAGDARFEVLTPEVVRLEYSPTGSFLDLPTFNVLDRDFPVPAYTESARGGWIYLATTDLVLRYQLGSGPFNPTNTQVQLLHPLSGTASVVAPSWEWECTFGQVCQSGAATLAGGAALSTGQANYQSPAGFITGYSAAGASATWQLLGAPAGNATVTLRYANGTGGGRTMSLVVNGTTTQVTLPPTPSWDDWATLSEPVALPAGSNTVALSLW